MEHGRRERADAGGQKHVAELGHGRVRQHALDVVLHEADRRGHQRGERADDRHDLHHERGLLEEDRVAGDEIDAGGHHRGGVDQGGHGRRPFHRIRQPDMEWNLRALPRRAGEEEQAHDRQDAEPPGLARHGGGRRRDLAKIERAEREEHEEDAKQAAQVADPVGEERLLPGVRRAGLLVPEADQQVRAEADPFPAGEQHEEVPGQDEDEHEEAEQVEVAEEARVRAPRLVLHVGRRVHMDDRADAGHDEQHHRRERIEAERPGDGEAADPVRRGEQDRRDPRRPAPRRTRARPPAGRADRRTPTPTGRTRPP